MEPTLQSILDKVSDLSQKQAAGALSPEQKTLLDGLSAKLTQYDEKQNTLAGQLHEAESTAAEQKQRIIDLEEQLINGPQGKSVDYRNTATFKALNQLVTKGFNEVEEKANLLRDTDENGGFLTTSEMDDVIHKDMVELSPWRQVCRVRRMKSKSLNAPRQTGGLTATYEGETAKPNDSAMTYGSETITNWRLTTVVPITMELLNDAEFDMYSEIMGEMNVAFAAAEGKNFTTGDGIKKPSGILANTDVTGGAVTSAAVGAIDDIDLFNLIKSLKAGYSGILAMNRSTLFKLRTLKGSDGHYLWQPGLNGATPNTIAGEPYILVPDMPDVAANSFSIAYGDFRRGYTITDRVGTTIIRDDFTLAAEGMVRFVGHRFNSGGVVLPAAIKVLKTKAA